MGGEEERGDMRTQKSGVESQKLNTARSNIAFESADCHEVRVGEISALSLALIFFFCEIRAQATELCCSCR